MEVTEVNGEFWVDLKGRFGWFPERLPSEEEEEEEQEQEEEGRDGNEDGGG